MSGLLAFARVPAEVYIGAPVVPELMILDRQVMVQERDARPHGHAYRLRIKSAFHQTAVRKSFASASQKLSGGAPDLAVREPG
jgi:hypothetical protein